jgi:toxin-antitoxin system PIN domain toxin
MILVDANLLLYAYNSGVSHHPAARSWLEEALSGAEPVCFAWQVLLAFVRIATGPKPFSRPLRYDDALGLVSSWLEQPCVRLLEPGERHLQLLRQLGVPAQARGPIVMDAHLAALAVEHGATLCSTDRDFARFEGLKWRNPLLSS